MLVLSIDTCGPNGTVALARLGSDAIEIVEEAELAGKTYSVGLVPVIHAQLTGLSAAVADVEAIVVTSGPGSFTGIRIALSSAKGLAEVCGTPILAVSRLAVLAHKAGTQAAALDASRREFYFGDYTGTELRESLIPAAHFEQLASTFVHNLAVCEESALAVAPHATFVQPPTAGDALRFALPRLRARSFDDPVTLDGNYIRRSDAEIFAKTKAATTQP
jgi:tRNA threonylcarbamoyladenosine biosynthesis protein TsaB